MRIKEYIPKRKFHDLTYAWGEWIGKGYQNEENFEICNFQIAKIIILRQQSINIHSLYTKMRLRNMLKICLAFGNLSLSIFINVMLIKKVLSLHFSVKVKVVPWVFLSKVNFAGINFISAVYKIARKWEI